MAPPPRSGRALAVTLVEFSPSGGLFQFAFQEGEALAARGHRVELLTGPAPELAARVPGMTVTPILPTWHPADGAGDAPLLRKARRGWRALRYLAAWRAVNRHVRRTRPDVVQWSNWRFALDGGMVARLARAGARWPRPPVFAYVAHSPRPFNEQRRDGAVFKDGGALGRGLRRAYAAMDVVFALGPDSARDLRAHFPGVRRVEVVPHGDEDVFLDGAPDPGDAGPVALFFGTLQAYKGVGDLVEAFAGVRRRVPDARLVIAGAPSAEVDTAALARRAAEAGGVELRLGYVPVAEVAPLVRAARLVALPYRDANASGVAHLAHSLSRPVVTTSVGDLTAAVAHGETGLVVPPRDREALATAIADLLADPERAARLGARGREALAARASWPAIASRMEAVFADCRAPGAPGDRAAR
ncbi:MAG TPA: glycosyltransferase family 4 protein [Streptosporangiaceae bacterium]